MTNLTNILVAAATVAALCVDVVYAKSMSSSFPIVSREEWGAKPPILVESMKNPLPFVVIHHSYIPGACTNASACESSMRSMQRMHQEVNKWNDIGYSFAVGGDGRAYMGRGWSAIGAHAVRYNNKSIGICIIGDWRYELPPTNQLNTVKDLIRYGMRMGYIMDEFQLIGHREASATECPGDALFNEVKRWRNLNGTANKDFKDDEDIDNIIP